jgi:3-oxoacyl-[acyl-carrier protein] reductase
MNELSGRTPSSSVPAAAWAARSPPPSPRPAPPVIAVSRTAAAFPEPAHGAGSIQPEVADAANATAPARLLDRYQPQAVILVAGASPLMRPLQRHTWETFSVNWHTLLQLK